MRAQPPVRRVEENVPLKSPRRDSTKSGLGKTALQSSAIADAEFNLCLNRAHTSQYSDRENATPVDAAPNEKGRPEKQPLSITCLPLVVATVQRRTVHLPAAGH